MKATIPLVLPSLTLVLSPFPPSLGPSHPSLGPSLPSVVLYSILLSFSHVLAAHSQCECDNVNECAITSYDEARVADLQGASDICCLCAPGLN